MTRCFRDINEYFNTVCNHIVQSANDALKQKKRFSIALSGGRTPIHIFENLKKNYLTRVDWSHVHFFWVDERCVDPNNDDSNYGLAYRNFLIHLKGVGSINRIEGELNPEEAAFKYDNLIANYLRKFSEEAFDYCLLGMGEDGHVASIFPHEQNIMTGKHVSYTSKKINGQIRISLNELFLNSCHKNVLLVNTMTKRDILDTKSKGFPINRIRLTDLMMFSND